MVRLGNGAGAQSLCVKPFDKRLVNMDHELLAADILRAAGVRVPAARLASQAEIDEQMSAGWDPAWCYLERAVLKFNPYGNTGRCTRDDQCICLGFASPATPPSPSLVEWDK